MGDDWVGEQRDIGRRPHTAGIWLCGTQSRPRPASGSVRRLTHNGDDGWIIPEFAWNPTNQFLMWTEARYPDGVRVPLPFDATRQLQQTAGYVRGLKPPSPTVPTVPTPGDISRLPLERRTEIGRFA